MSKPTVNYVQYDGSTQQAEVAGKALTLINDAQGKAFESASMSNQISRDAVADVQVGVSLLGEYLKDRNASVSNQIPLSQGYLKTTTDLNKKYAGKASLLGGY
jgi:hypothetical protein